MKFESKKVFFRIILTKGCITKTQEETIPPKAKKLKENVLTKETVRKIIKISINGVNAYTAFSLAQDLNDSNELFNEVVESAKTALGISDEVVEIILQASILDF